MMVPATGKSAPRPVLPRELLDSPSFLLKRLGHVARDQVMDAFERTGLSPHHHAVLTVLDERPPDTQGAIADVLGYDRGQLVGMLDELEERGLIQRQRDPDDRRRHIVRLTPDGARALKHLRTVLTETEEDFFAPLDADQRETLRELLLQLVKRHDPNCAEPTEAAAAPAADHPHRGVSPSPSDPTAPVTAGR
jgi:DNA-binding MarR family transcriptional regulator